jgi:deoxyribose-phosphate aldolase
MSTPEFTYDQIAKMIDHSLLNPVLTTAELEAGCDLAAQFNTASVCILPYCTTRCHELLAGTTVYTSTTIGFSSRWPTHKCEALRGRAGTQRWRAGT